MARETLKWLASIGLGVATAALAWAQAHLGSGPNIDPFLAGLIVGVVSKIINWLTAQIPTTPA